MEVLSYEQQAHDAGYALVCGVDEAGAGPLMGPVYAAAVILPEKFELPGLNDSKKLTEKKREALFLRIQQQALTWSVASVSAGEIDETDILSARMKAMQLAIDGLAPRPDFALIDGNRDHGKFAAVTTPHRCIVGGDAHAASIAAASILAKVSRDREMAAFELIYPGYGIGGHKGYPTPVHLEALARLGPTPIHRRSFAPVRQAYEVRESLVEL